MKRYIPIVASLMVFSLISCDEVMDLTQPEKAEVTYSNITLSLYQTGKYDLYLDEPEYQYNIMVEKSHCEKEAKAKLAVVDAKEFDVLCKVKVCALLVDLTIANNITALPVGSINRASFKDRHLCIRIIHGAQNRRLINNPSFYICDTNILLHTQRPR